jgi:flavin-dependent dehydrogenase
MSERYDVIIAGGGLAGCGAAIQLAQKGARVLLLEQKALPMHKLCGEFLSGEAAGSLARLGVLEAVRAAGAVAIERVVLSDGARPFSCDLPAPALGLSRYRLDPILWQRAGEAGADCRAGVSVQAIHGDLKKGFCVQTSAGDFRARLALAAHGKRAKLDETLQRPTALCRSPYVAFKAHFRGNRVMDAIEMYGFPGGYCGISPIENELVNVCWIAHERALQDGGGRVEEMVERVLKKNPALQDRLSGMALEGKFKGISNIRLGAKGTFQGDVCLIGDAAGMIAPLCGDGMAMALRSAEIAAPLAGSFLSGQIDAPAFRGGYTNAWKREFGMRLFLGRWAHSGGISPPLAHAWLGLLHASPSVGRWLIEKTRG